MVFTDRIQHKSLGCTDRVRSAQIESDTVMHRGDVMCSVHTLKGYFVILVGRYFTVVDMTTVVLFT